MSTDSKVTGRMEIGPFIEMSALMQFLQNSQNRKCHTLCIIFVHCCVWVDLPTTPSVTALALRVSGPQCQIIRLSQCYSINALCESIKIMIQNCRQTSNISRTLVGNKIVDHSAPVGAAPTTFFTFGPPADGREAPVGRLSRMYL